MTTMSSDQPTNFSEYMSDINKYLKGDLETFHKICIEFETSETLNSEMASPLPRGYQPPENEVEYFNLTIPITLMLFAVVDVVGYLVREKGSITTTRSNFEEFFNFTKSSPLSLSEEDNALLFKKDILLNKFRHGIVHGCFPKLWRGVSYRSKNKSKPLIFPCKGYDILNVNRLEEIVIATFDHIKENKELHSRMEFRYNCLIDQYQKWEVGENTKA